MTCIIIGAGEINTPGPIEEIVDMVRKEGSFVIAADGGLSHLAGARIVPDVIIGDFDSFKGSMPRSCPNRAKCANSAACSQPEIIKLDTHKNYTDLMEAARLGYERGFRNFRIYGALGGRLDHTLGNMQLLLWLVNRGASARIIGDKETFTAVKDGKMQISGAPGAYFSVYSATEKAEGVTIRGAKYEVDDVTLNNDFPIGVSNEFMGSDVMIEVRNGSLLVIVTDRDDNI